MGVHPPVLQDRKRASDDEVFRDPPWRFHFEPRVDGAAEQRGVRPLLCCREVRRQSTRRHEHVVISAEDQLPYRVLDSQVGGKDFPAFGSKRSVELLLTTNSSHCGAAGTSSLGMALRH
jgi:hypothetical protein